MDPQELDELIDEAIADIPPEGPMKFLVGQVMKASKGKSNPVMTKILLWRKIYDIPYSTLGTSGSSQSR